MRGQGCLPLLRKGEDEMAFQFESANLKERPSVSYRVITQEPFGLGYSSAFDTVEAASAFARFEEEHGNVVLRIEASDGSQIPVETASVACKAAAPRSAPFGAAS